MSESPETPGSTDRGDDAGRRESGLFRALAWVGIIAGVVFTVAVIFFSGFLLGRASDGHKGWQRGYQSAQPGQAAQSGQGGCPMMRDGSMMIPGDMMSPGDMGPGRMRPDQPTSSPQPSPAVPSPPPQR